MKEKTYYFVLIILLSVVLIVGFGFDMGAKYWFYSTAIWVTYVSLKKDFTGKKWFKDKPKKLSKTLSPPLNEEDLPYICKQEKNGYISLARLCLSPDKRESLIAFVETLKDSPQHDGFMTTLESVVEYSDNNDLFFIMTLDWKQDIETLEWRLNESLLKNFGISIEIPNALDYGEKFTVSHDHVFEDYDQPLRAKGLQIGFIDTDADEYVIFVHKSEDKDIIENAVNAIGYNYYETKKQSVGEYVWFRR